MTRNLNKYNNQEYVEDGEEKTNLICPKCGNNTARTVDSHPRQARCPACKHQDRMSEFKVDR